MDSENVGIYNGNVTSDDFKNGLKKEKSDTKLSLKIQQPPQGAFANKQLGLFQNLYGNTDAQLSAASNSIELWDSIPRYSISQKGMNKIRDDKGRLDLLEITFQYRGITLKTIIHPALIQEKIDGVRITRSYYPSANEELVEEALRKIATTQQRGFHEPFKRSGVVFTLYELRDELKRRGHTRSYDEIIKSLTILSTSIIEIIGEDKQHNKSYGKRSAYFPAVTWVSRADLLEDPHAKWHVQFHPLITDSIDKLTYRQFDYQKLMSHTSQLARWIHKYLVNKYVMASKMKPFEMRYSTIKRDSAMLNGYKEERQGVAACDSSMEELKTQNIAHKIEQHFVRGARKKIIDVIYTITPTLEFIAEVKKANARLLKLKSLQISK